MSEYNFPFVPGMWSTDLLPFCFCTDVQSACEVFLCYPCMVNRLQFPHGYYKSWELANTGGGQQQLPQNNLNNRSNYNNTDPNLSVSNASGASVSSHGNNNNNNNNQFVSPTSGGSPTSNNDDDSEPCTFGGCLCYTCLVTPCVYFAVSSWMAVRETTTKYSDEATSLRQSTHLPQHPLWQHCFCPCCVVSMVVRERVIRGERISCWNGHTADQRMLCCDFGKGNHLRMYGRYYDDDDGPEEMFLKAIEKNDLEKVSSMLDGCCASSNDAQRLIRTRRDDDSPLLMCAQSPDSSVKMLQLLIDKITELGLFKSEMKSSILKAAVQSGGVDKVLLLLYRAANIEDLEFSFEAFFAMSLGWTQQTALMDACVAGNIDIVRILISFYPDPLVCEHWVSVEVNGSGMTAIDLAKKHKQSELVELLEDPDKLNKCKGWYNAKYPAFAHANVDSGYIVIHQQGTLLKRDSTMNTSGVASLTSSQVGEMS